MISSSNAKALTTGTLISTSTFASDSTFCVASCIKERTVAGTRSTFAKKARNVKAVILVMMIVVIIIINKSKRYI